MGIGVSSASPVLFFEWAIEAAFPCPSGLVGGVASLFNNIVALIFLGLFLIPDIGKNKNIKHAS